MNYRDGTITIVQRDEKFVVQIRTTSGHGNKDHPFTGFGAASLFRDAFLKAAQ
jgi:hypothetical protein